MNHRYFKSQTNSSNTHLNGKKTKTLGIKCDCSCYKVFFFYIVSERNLPGSQSKRICFDILGIKPCNTSCLSCWCPT